MGFGPSKDPFPRVLPGRHGVPVPRAGPLGQPSPRLEAERQIRKAGRKPRRCWFLRVSFLGSVLTEKKGKQPSLGVSYFETNQDGKPVWLHGNPFEKRVRSVVVSRKVDHQVLLIRNPSSRTSQRPTKPDSGSLWYAKLVPKGANG